MEDTDKDANEEKVIEYLRSELAKTEPTRKKRIVEKFVLASLNQRGQTRLKSFRLINLLRHHCFSSPQR